MNDLDSMREERVPWRRRVPVGAVVTVALLVLLHGPAGAVIAVAYQAWVTVAMLLGGEQAVLAVLGQTAPLALATAAITLLYHREWITFESMWSVLACAAILIGGASIGGELRGLCQRVLPAQATKEAKPPSTDFTLLGLNMMTDPKTNKLPASVAWRAVSNWRYMSSLGVDQQWPDRVPRVALLPEGTSAFGIVSRGVNQLLGYLVFYRPRMFLAALLAGWYVGWAVHRRMEKTHAAVIEFSHHRHQGRAA